MKRAQSTWLTSLPCPPFQKYSHPAVQWQTQGFTRAASPLRLTDWAAFFALKTASSLQLELPLTLQTWAPVRLYILDHPATSQANKPLVAVVVLFPGLWNLDTKVCLIWTSGTTEKDYWNCRRPPPRFLNWVHSFELKILRLPPIPTTDPIMPHSFQQKKGELCFLYIYLCISGSSKSEHYKCWRIPKDVFCSQQ